MVLGLSRSWLNSTKLSAPVFPLSIIAVVAAIYFGSFYRFGFDWGDMGSYAQISYELYLGAKPGDFLSYGPLWYFFGEGLFYLWGVDFGALLLMFQVIIFLSAVLLFLGVRAATGRIWVAFLAGLIFILVPPFFASSIRSISLGLFLCPFIMFARAELGRDVRALVLSAIGIGLNFLLRPDFGYLYLAALIPLIAIRAWYTGTTAGERLRYFIRLSVIVGAVVIAVLLPLAVHAIIRDYWQAILRDFLSYPRRFLFLILHAAGFIGMAGDSGQPQATFLRILPFSALYGEDRGNRVFAFLIYSTLLVLIVFFGRLLFRWIRHPLEVRSNLLRLAVLIVVGSQWPTFAMFRPEWIHFVSFMHAYLVLAGCLAVWLTVGDWPKTKVGKIANTAGLLVLAIQMSLFVGYGERADQIGWWAKRSGRTTEFQARNGVQLKVTPSEKKIFDKIAGVIENNSKPGDSIVCVPYCAGFAFMTGRHLLFKQHYVDDSTPQFYPGWIDQAIVATTKALVPVVIVLDWAPNGTTASRFDVWAARYVDFVRRTYPVSIPFAMGTIWLLHPVDLPPVQVETVIGYGPTGTMAGEPFNLQPNGVSALWMKLSRPMEATAVIHFNDRPLTTVVDGSVLTALVPSELFVTPGRHWLQVVDTEENITTQPVPFDVIPR